jgi:hypothetical protein
VYTTPGDWKGRAAIVLTFLTPPNPAKKVRGCPTIRTVIYIDPDTRLCMALQAFSQPPNRPEYLVGEAEYDFNTRPDPSIFDPHRLEEGAAKITRVKGYPGVQLSPE